MLRLDDNACARGDARARRRLALNGSSVGGAALAPSRRPCAHGDATYLVVFSQQGVVNERILAVHVDMPIAAAKPLGAPASAKPYANIRQHIEPYLLLSTKEKWEGAHALARKSAAGKSNERNALRDPFVLRDRTTRRVWLFYAGGGETAIGVVELKRM